MTGDKLESCKLAWSCSITANKAAAKTQNQTSLLGTEEHKVADIIYMSKVYNYVFPYSWKMYSLPVPPKRLWFQTLQKRMGAHEE